MSISSTTRKAGPYTGNGSTTVFPFSFKVFQASDLVVVKTDLSGVETTLVLTTNYTVSLNANQDSNPGGTITCLSAPASGFKITVTSAVPELQPVTLTNMGGFYPTVINDALDRLTIFAQELSEKMGRAVKVPISSDVSTDQLSYDILRLADSVDNIDSVATNISSVVTVANDLNEPVSEINTVANSITNVDTVGANISNVNTVAGINANVTSVAGNATNINAVAGNATNINAVNANSANINTVAGSNTAVTTVATNITAVNSAYTNLAAIIDAPNQAAAAANSAAAAAASAASGMYSAVQDKSANYTIVAADAGDLIRVSTGSGAVTITLPLISGAGIGDGFKIAVTKWTSDANVVNIARSGSNTINGATSAQIGSQYSQIILVADAETSTWFASQSGLGATNINVDTFSGNGSTTGFTLTSDPSTKNNTAVYISGVYQQKSTYSLSGTTLTFSTAPPTGTANIEVAYSTPLAIGTPSDGTVTAAKIVDGAVTLAKLSATGTPDNTKFLRGDNSWQTVAVTPTAVSDQSNTSTGYFGLPSGTTAQRPASPTNGMLRYNTTLAVFEWYNGNTASWQPVFQPAGYYVQIFLCAGGGGGGGGESNPGGDGGAGGGGGGLVNCGSYVNTLNTYTVTVGAGGAGGVGAVGPGSNTSGAPGSDSFFNNVVAFGGGGGGDGNGGQAGPGGSGGGAANEYNTTSYGGGGVWSQGNKGGDCPGSTVNRGAPGGGGAGSAGTDKSSNNGANGGAPAYNGIAGGQPLYYAGGGGGGPCGTASAGSGGNGLGIGGNGGTNTSAPGTGTTNRGGGGGGGVGHNVSSSYTNGANGGSGQVIIAYQNSTQRGSGGTVTSFTRNGVTTWVHTFNTSGTFTA